MPYFSTVSEGRLAGCHPAIRKIAHHLVRDFDISVLNDGGWRSPERQLELYNNNFSKVKKSKHNYMRINEEGIKVPWSQALDIAPYPVDFGRTPKSVLASRVDRTMTARDAALLAKELILAEQAKCRFFFMAGRAMEVASRLNIEIRWGGDWDSDNDFFDQSFNDLAHIELMGRALEDDLYDGSY